MLIFRRGSRKAHRLTVFGITNHWKLPAATSSATSNVINSFCCHWSSLSFKHKTFFNLAHSFFYVVHMSQCHSSTVAMSISQVRPRPADDEEEERAERNPILILFLLRKTQRPRLK